MFSDSSLHLPPFLANEIFRICDIKANTNSIHIGIINTIAVATPIIHNIAKTIEPYIAVAYSIPVNKGCCF